MANAAHHGNSDAADVMDQIIDGFTNYVSNTERVVKGSRRYRLSLLWVHAVAALLMAPAFQALGQEGMVGGAWYYLRQVPGMPTTLAVVLGLGGAILGVGCVLLNRIIEAVGLAFLALFYVSLGFGFGMAVFAYYTGDLSATKPAPYTPILYAHMTIIMIVHMGTLVRVILAPKD